MTTSLVKQFSSPREIMRKRERKRSDKSELRRVSVKRDGEIAERLRALV